MPKKPKWTTVNLHRSYHRRIVNMVRALEKETGRRHTVGGWVDEVIGKALDRAEKKLNGGERFPDATWNPKTRLGKVTEHEDDRR